MQTHIDAPEQPNSVPPSFRGPKVSERKDGVGQDRQQTFPGTATASDWVIVHIPESERSLIKM